MSGRLPRLNAKQIILILERRGFVLARSSGSHHIFKKPEGMRVTVPVHSGRIPHPKIPQSILRDMDMTPSELKKELKR
jgi:predicted RNA binding protein YcfA (HicA-like mRNA interferase family)